MICELHFSALIFFSWYFGERSLMSRLDCVTDSVVIRVYLMQNLYEISETKPLITANNTLKSSHFYTNIESYVFKYIIRFLNDADLPVQVY